MFLIKGFLGLIYGIFMYLGEFPSFINDYLTVLFQEDAWPWEIQIGFDKQDGE